MDPALEKKRLDKLARVRENQRRSRARRQDHLQDLEQKVLVLQKELERRDVAHRLAIQKLEAENKKLRDVLSASGIPSPALEAFLQRVDNPLMAQKVAIPALQRSKPKSCGQLEDPTKCASPASCARKPPDDAGSGTENPESVDTANGEFTDSLIETRPEKVEKSLSPELASFCACSPEEGLESLPISERVLNTTLCGVAEQLVKQYNTRGVDISEIQKRLREGFLRGIAEEGCRVQNQILFQVLDEISGQ
ncbi:bZIP transcription factor [Aspergillus lucknowensis]|uniref:BZIP domain-containing protein n=1 Tax=Aspergillus lucknowensis TaxID=176173 RepID=A0ABR4M3I6_9EURO